MAVSVSVKNSKTANSNKNNYQSLGFSLYECLWSAFLLQQQQQQQQQQLGGQQHLFLFLYECLWTVLILHWCQAL